MKGASSAILGTFDDEPTCIEITMPSSFAAANTGSQ